MTVANVIARRHTGPVPPPTFHEGIARPAKSSHMSETQTDADDDEYAIPPPTDDPVSVRILGFTQYLSSAIQFDPKFKHILGQLRSRMKHWKLHVDRGANRLAATYNESFKPEIISQQNDPFRILWIDETCTEEALVGEKVQYVNRSKLNSSEGFSLGSPTD